jgi:DNA primase
MTRNGLVFHTFPTAIPSCCLSLSAFRAHNHYGASVRPQMTSTSSDNFKETLKQQADIVRIVGDYVKLKKAGAQNFSGLCPFHAEKTPSFSVHATRQFFHCFGCGESGDVFTFIQKVENITFPEAVRLIAQKLGVPMPKMSFSSPAEARDAQVRMALLDVHVRATQFFQECLRRPEGANAREYLKGRGLDDETIASLSHRLCAGFRIPAAGRAAA